MKIVRYFFAEDGVLWPLDKSHQAVQETKWHRDETLKIELWPFDLKIGPTKIPYESKYKRGGRVAEIIALTTESRRQREEAWANKTSVIRLNQESSVYSQEFTKRDDARNRAYLSKKVPKRRKDSEEPPTQTDAPF